MEANLQAVACALVFRQGVQVKHVVTAAGKRTPEEVECFSLQIGISAALSQGCSWLVVFSDSASAVETLLDPDLRSGQVFSLDACKAVCPWFAEDEAHTLTLWHVPSCWEWGVHKKAHDAAASVRVGAGPRPCTSRDFQLVAVDKACNTEWHAWFSEPSYRGQSFLELKGPKGRPLLPSTLKGGPWMLALETELTSFTRLCHGITCHAPIAEYRAKFNIDGPIHCDCSYFLRQTRYHLVCVCRNVTRPHQRRGVGYLTSFVGLLGANPVLFAFTTSIRLAWDPG
jgi:Reverse transcriptase-like